MYLESLFHMDFVRAKTKVYFRITRNTKVMVYRLIPIDEHPQESFFLWGPRQVGKSWVLRHRFPEAPYRDLLHTELYLRYLNAPQLLREEFLASQPGQLVILDEVQRVPALLDEVHWLIENRGISFALCGSSARKVRRGHANLLGGRAIRWEMFGLVSAELGPQFDLQRALNHGNLPRHYLAEAPGRLLKSYVQDYLTEEIAAEGLVRNLPGFSSFLRAAALSDSEVVSFVNIARDCGVSAPTVKEYFQILSDTLLARFLPVYTKRAKRRVVQSPKFYFANVGVVNHLNKRGKIVPGTELFGKALENWIFHELSACLHYRESDHELTFWRISSGQEVDFVIGDAQVAIEVKASTRIDHHDLKGLREFAKEFPSAEKLFLICLDPIPRSTEDGIVILDIETFLKKLWNGEVFSG